MKKFQALLLVSFFSLLPLNAQTYQAEEKASLPKNERRWLEISASWTRSLTPLKDHGGYTQLSHQEGLSGRALFVITPWFSLGAEGTRFETEKGIAMVSAYREKRYGAVGKFTLTPNTQPKVYVLAGAGKTKRELSYQFSLDESSKMNYLEAAIGLEVAVWKGLFLAAEFCETYNAHKHIGRFFEQKHRLEPSISGRIGISF